MDRRRFLRAAGAATVAPGMLYGAGKSHVGGKRPNILFCIADDWGAHDAGAYGRAVVETPNFDRIARDGALFERAYVTAPSCTPCRNSILTGQWHWRLGPGANLHSTLSSEHPVFPFLLEQAGYVIGHHSKAWGPGNLGAMGRKRDPAGPQSTFAEFLKKRPRGRPFCFWMGTHKPHRGYDFKSGANSGIDISKIRLPADLPDHETVRHDVADYFLEVRRWDREVGQALELLEATGELDNTIVVMTGDHGMPFPRHKCHLYDSGTLVPLAIMWPSKVSSNRRVDDFVSLMDLAPTFLEAAGADVPDVMTGRSLMDVLLSDRSGQVDATRDHVITGRERHTPAQEYPSMSGYPSRAIRTGDYLYVRNFAPDRWPAGVPENSTRGVNYGDCDNGPTKDFIINHKDDAKVRTFYELAFARRPGQELYDLKKDPHQFNNVAGRKEYAGVQDKLWRRLEDELRATGDPRVVGGGEKFDRYPYYGRMRKLPESRRKEIHL